MSDEQIPSFEVELETFKILHCKLVETSAQIEALVQKCHNLLRLAGSVADRIAAAKRPYVAPAPPAKAAELTAWSEGPFRVWKFLAVNRQEFQRDDLASRIGISASTLRTYLPVLGRAGVVSLGGAWPCSNHPERH